MINKARDCLGENGIKSIVNPALRLNFRSTFSTRIPGVSQSTLPKDLPILAATIFINIFNFSLNNEPKDPIGVADNTIVVKLDLN